jgi:CheY-like chemotaxis protein
VAKILVADDNSNVQKTVALALADLGVEVVAVNNGDAAVRKLADISPDLVLADIFMPVRNGYEVCEFVKKDSRFSHVPVVLLVGAFDPLDEREAQRVGADGILKKPFVPPDPLIMMVKTLLERTLGDRLVAVGAAKPAVSIQNKAGGISTTQERPSAPETSEELPLEEFRPPVDRLSFGEGERPIAFGQLLDTPPQEPTASVPPVVEPVDDEQILTSSRDASLGDPIFWRTEEPELEPETEEENSEAEVDLSSGPPMRPWKPDEETSSRHAEADFLQPVETFELVRDEKDEEATQTSMIVETSASIVQDAASQASLNVEAAKPEDLAANPIEWMASVPPPPAEKAPEAVADWGGLDSEGAENLGGNEPENLKSTSEPVAPESSAAVIAPVSVSTSSSALPLAPPPAVPLAPPQTSTDIQIPDPIKTQPSLKPLTQSAEDTARSIPKHDWADLAASLLPKSIEPVAEKAKPFTVPLVPAPAVPASGVQPASTNFAATASKPLEQSTEDTARSIPKHDWADMAESLKRKTNEPVSEKPEPAAAPVAQNHAVPALNTVQPATTSVSQIPSATAVDAQPASSNSASPVSPDPALVEAVVQRILDKMRPQVVDIITKEFLQPIVQALVHREIEKH